MTITSISTPKPKPLIDTCQHLKDQDWKTFIPPSFAPHDLIFCLDFLPFYYFNLLQKAPKVKKVIATSDVAMVLRKDEIFDRDASVAEKLIKAAPDKKDDYIKVKNIF